MASVSVCLSFDFDAISVWIGSMQSKSPSAISRGEFGVVGAARILDTLDRYGIRSTWFIPGHTIDTFPGAARAVADRGHEIGHHNYCHENPRTLSLEQEREVIERGIECIDRLTGRRPIGYRSPAADHSANTVSLLVEHGFLYDSTLMAHDFQPYYARAGDQVVTGGPFAFGQPVPLVEVPIDWSLDDWPYFGLNWNAHHVGLRTPHEVLATWQAEFDYLYHRLGEGVYTLTMHPQIMGRGSRLLMLEQFIEYLQGHEGVTFQTLGEVAARWKSAHPFEAGR